MDRLNYSQTRIRETQRAVKKVFLLSIVSFISCPVTTVLNIETMNLMDKKVSYIGLFCFFGSHFLQNCPDNWQCNLVRSITFLNEKLVQYIRNFFVFVSDPECCRCYQK